MRRGGKRTGALSGAWVFSRYPKQLVAVLEFAAPSLGAPPLSHFPTAESVDAVLFDHVPPRGAARSLTAHAIEK
jgi:hypothetical protein